MWLEERFALFAGQVSYPDICRGEPSWCTPALVCTEAARSRLSSWCAGGGFDRQAPNVREVLKFYGDAEMLPIVVDAYEQLPPPARDYVLEHAVIIATGYGTNGWTGAPPPQASNVIVICGASRNAEQIRRTSLHEGAHVWLEPTSRCIAPERGRVDTIAALAREDGGAVLRRLETEMGHLERRAERLTAEWQNLRARVQEQQK